MKYGFRGLLTENGWLENASVRVNEEGRIVSVNANEAADEFIDALALPGFQNAHSHAFQYVMAGLTENRSGGGSADNFWSWRHRMYDIALGINPDEMQEIATWLYREMVRFGYTSVAEFHYLHHDPNGISYENPAEMGERLIAAAADAGIRITLIPMYYNQGSFGKAPSADQRRFLSPNPDAYYTLLEASRKAVANYDNARLGTGIHSLRAVTADHLKEIPSTTDKHLPFHIHIAEQLKEVQDCLAHNGQRPVEWLMENIEVSPRFHLVHATHLTDQEVASIAASGAHVVLCPSTEGNLGDGIFRLNDFMKAGGRWSIGTDSHIGLDPFEELRLLDYGQRLITHRRDTFLRGEGGDAGLNAIQMAWTSGKAAMGEPDVNGFFEKGKPFDAMLIDASHPLINSTAPGSWASTLVYAGNAIRTCGTFINGVLIHPEEQQPVDKRILQKFRK